MTLPIQIKSNPTLRVHGEPAPFTLRLSGEVTILSIDGREVPIAAHPGAPIDDIARSIARVPKALQSVLAEIAVSSVANPADALWAQTYGLPVHSGMGAVASGSGKVVIYPHGLDQLHSSDADVFVRNLMHEMGHCWSLRDWAITPSAKQVWLDAMASDPSAASQYALLSFRNSGLPYEDVAETTALYFLVLGSPRFHESRATMPARFALLGERFGSES